MGNQKKRERASFINSIKGAFFDIHEGVIYKVHKIICKKKFQKPTGQIKINMI